MERPRGAQIIAASAVALALLAFESPAAADSKTAAPAGDPNTVTINFAGDLAYPAGWGGWDYVEKQKHLLYRQIQRILDSADLNFVNVECPITEKSATADKRYPIRCKPHQIPYFVEAGFNLLSLANNHSTDAGTEGLLDTHENLKKASTDQRPLWWGGTGDSSEAAAQPARFKVPGKNLVVAVFFVANTSGRGKVGGLHDKSLPDRIAEEAKHSDIVIVSSHHGPEYHHAPWPWTTKIYRSLIDAGATVVVGHHPHVVQGFERYKHGFIFYSMGNFSFASKTNRHLPTGARLYSLIGRVTFGRDARGQAGLERIELIPLYANNKQDWPLEGKTIDSRHAEPQLLHGAFANYALDDMLDFTTKVPGWHETRFIRVGDRAFVDLGRPMSDADKKRELARQKREYQAVIDAGVQPREAKESEMRRNQRGGTPWPPRGEKKKKKKKKKRGKRGKKK
jgi:poly-gamma-glutamate synthesis protein (capsule biosynthesis protein)